MFLLKAFACVASIGLTILAAIVIGSPPLTYLLGAVGAGCCNLILSVGLTDENG